MHANVQSVISDSNILHDNVEVRNQRIPNGSHQYAQIHDDESTYFLKSYNFNRKSPDWFVHSKHILSRMDQSPPEIWDWFGTEHEYQMLKYVNNKLPSVKSAKITVPTPVELIGDSAILMESLPDHKVIFQNKDLIWGMNLFDRDARLEIVKSLATALAQLQKYLSDQEQTDFGKSCRAHADLAADSTLPHKISEFLRNFSYTQLQSLPAVRIHGDFSPRNIIVTEMNQIGFVDWPLSIVSNPLVDVHEFLCHIDRWQTYPGTANTHIRRLEKSFREQYLLESPFNITEKQYKFTELTALIRNYWKFVDNTEGIKGFVNCRTYRDTTKERIEEITKFLEV